MKKILTILSVMIFTAFLVMSCGQSNTKKKELELKERELALKEKELALKEKGISNSESSDTESKSSSNEVTPKIKPTSENEIQKTNFDKDDFLGCWYWGEGKDGFAILKVKPNGILTIHRIDLNNDIEAGYKIIDNKIIFTKNNLLMQNKFHLETIKNNIFLVEEYPNNPGKFKNRYRRLGIPLWNTFDRWKPEKNTKA